MKNGLAKRLSALLVSGVLLLGMTAPVLADTTNKPYLKTFGSDVMTGGWFSSGTNCQTGAGTNYQDTNFSSSSITSDTRHGGILTYTKTPGTSSGGASSQYGAIGIGEIDGRRAGDGFYSAGALAAPVPSGTISVKALSFANDDGTYPFGGLFEGSVGQRNCIPDYYSKKPASASPLGNQLAGAYPPARGGTFGSLGFATCNTNVYCLTQSDVNIKAGTLITIYVNGNVYIDHNVTYDSSSKVDNVPKFALIVSGSIYIDKSVTQLDGLYVAEPSITTPAAVAADNGIIWTCHPNNTATLDYTYPPNCTSPLVVNGALIAKQVNWLRVNGNIDAANTGEDSLGTVGSCTLPSTCNVSEVINYTPAMIMGGNFFSATGGGGSSGLPIDSVISLPPVF